MTQLNEIDASREIDAIEKHLLALIEQMHFKNKTNDRLEQHTTALTLLMKILINEMRYNRTDGLQKFVNSPTTKPTFERVTF